ncbi:hypothetical protein SACS_0561 [Parasaccharibacter apium]|uniref:Uncharacterized protein n=1 Tax=Parasaccharibacter apium TaxID=1510841 RepID=A0A7U7G573_9PROT|nr:hypothetical protein SACS_0561 [Parasaccharibacter apium]
MDSVESLPKGRLGSNNTDHCRPPTRYWNLTNFFPELCG